eukprot:CAMPEP_0204364670 /NCGR_PEP_ID=MMETSP0469-20131031/41320_1 /ASSEMBLY_ACC=CAM_ASM_000384 /TAXON_ID=2969 /ORGANISM="Oxyrrhis marina" /LENGTH=51 /DNA_ID=CAMNT_0051353617 /DNA_START=463 /DNA_END=615 /DNA_ORIENTATION=-
MGFAPWAPSAKDPLLSGQQGWGTISLSLRPRAPSWTPRSSAVFSRASLNGP